jgi:hypothetical protein
MKAHPSKTRHWRRDPPVPNPYRDTLSREIGYKLDSRYAGCLLIAIALSLLAIASVAFIVYWIMH